jgi:hypothetical protein
VDINICIFMSTTHLLNFKNSLLHFAVFQSFFPFFFKWVRIGYPAHFVVFLVIDVFLIGYN